MSRVHDLVVIGTGGVGSSALLAAAQRQWDVVGIDQFGAVHNLGSSHGQSRIIRAAYFEHPDYVPMAQRSFALWRSYQQTTRRPLFHQAGLIQIGTDDSPVIRGVRRSAAEHNLTIENLTASEVESRWPALRVPEDRVGVFEPGAGILRVENAIAHVLAMAKQAGAALITQCPVRDWSVDDRGWVRIETANGPLHTKRMVISAGPWAADLVRLPQSVTAATKLSVRRKQQNWFQVDRADIHLAAGFPCFLVDDPLGCFYGFPQLDSLGMKIAEHSGGQAVAHPQELDRGECPLDVARASQFAQHYFRFGRMRLSHSSVCMYTMSSDENFLVDLHPDYPQVAIVAGLSGHGFKFAPVLGEQAIRLLEGTGLAECEFLRLNRFAGPIT